VPAPNHERALKDKAFRTVSGRSGAGSAASGRLDEAVDHPLAAARLELDLELVAFLADDLAVAELVVEHPCADGDVGARLGGEAGRAAARLGEAPGRGVVAGAQRTLPAGPARLAALGPHAADVRERILLFGPVRAPQ